MTYDKGMFVKLDKTHLSKVRIGNGDYIEVKGIVILPLILTLVKE